MRRRYPSVRITPLDVVGFSRAQGQQPSMEDAERWLARRKRCIEEMMSVVIQNNLERILEEATLMGYADPVFDRQYGDIDEAIQTASDEYGRRMGLEQWSSSHDERDMLEIVRRMLTQHEEFTACFAYSNEFRKPTTSSKDGEVTHRTECVHLTCKGGKVRAEVVADDACEHGPDVFVPQRRMDPPAV